MTSNAYPSTTWQLQSQGLASQPRPVSPSTICESHHFTDSWRPFRDQRLCETHDRHKSSQVNVGTSMSKVAVIFSAICHPQAHMRSCRCFSKRVRNVSFRFGHYTKFQRASIRPPQASSTQRFIKAHTAVCYVWSRRWLQASLKWMQKA